MFIAEANNPLEPIAAPWAVPADFLSIHYGLKMVPLSENTDLLIQKIYPVHMQKTVTHLLENECGNNLPLSEKETPESLERFHFAVLKIGKGNMDKLSTAVELAKQDWRDLLVEAEFANSLEAHKLWAKINIKLEMSKRGHSRRLLRVGG